MNFCVVYVLIEETWLERKTELRGWGFLMLLLPSRFWVWVQLYGSLQHIVRFEFGVWFWKIWGNIYRGDSSLENLRLILKKIE